jgi:hypothetical protein
MVDDLGKSVSVCACARARRRTSSLEVLEMLLLTHKYLPWLGTTLAIVGWLLLFASSLRVFLGLDDQDLSQDARIALLSGTDSGLRIYYFAALGSYLSALLIAIVTWRRSSQQSIVTIGIMWPLAIIFALRLFN